jgi:hypothetical protein
MTKALQPTQGYAALLKDIRERVRTAQMRAALAVNGSIFCCTGRSAGTVGDASTPRAAPL